MFAFNVQTLGLMAWPHWFFANLLSRPALIIQEPLEYRTRDGNVLTPNNLFIATSIRVVLWPYLASPKSISEWSDAKEFAKTSNGANIAELGIGINFSARSTRNE